MADIKSWAYWPDFIARGEEEAEGEGQSSTGPALTENIDKYDKNMIK